MPWQQAETNDPMGGGGAVVFAEFGTLRAARKTVLILGPLVIVIVSACSTPQPAGPVPGSPTTSTAPTTSLSPVETAKQDAIEAYLGMWRSYAKAATTADWQSPLLTEFATGDALSAMVRGLRSDHDKGLIAKGQPKNNPAVSSAEPASDPAKVTIADCGDSSNWLRYRADTGQLADNEPEGRRSITAMLEKQPGNTWKVTGFAVRGVGTC